MKIFFVLSAFLFQSFVVQAATYNYKKHWSNSGLMQSDEKSQFGLELKKSPLIPDLPIAAVTYTKNNQEKKETVIALLKKTTNIQNWKVENIDGLEIHEGFSKVSGTVYRLAFNNKTNEFSVASIAARYLLPTYLEAHLFQVQHLTGKKAGSGKFSSFLRLFIQDVEAADINVNISPATTAQITGAITTLGNGVSGIRSDVRSAGDQISGAVTQATGTLQNVGNTVAGSVDNLAGAGNNVAGSVNNAADSVNNIADAVRESNQTVRDLTSSRNIAKQAAVAGAVFGLTSTLGSMAANFLVNETMSTLRRLFYEAKGEFTPEEKEMRLKRFESAMNSFNEMSPKLNELASKMTALSVEITLASGVTQEQYLSSIEREIEAARKAKTEAGTDCTDCMSEAAMKLNQLENLKKIVAATGNRTKDDMAKACEQMDDLYTEWVNAEFTMLNARRLIMQDLMLFNGYIMDSTASDTAFQEARKQSNHCKDRAERLIKEVKSKIDIKKCEGEVTHAESLLCRRYHAATGQLQSCETMAQIKFGDEQQVDLEESAVRFSSKLTQVSKTLAGMSCEKNAPTCDKAVMDKARNEVLDSFKLVADKCPNRFFATEMKKSTALKPAVVQAPPKPDDKPSLFRRIFGGGGNLDATSTNEGAAQVMGANY